MEAPPATMQEMMARFEELGRRVNAMAEQLAEARQEHGQLHRATEIEINRLEKRIKSTEEAMAKPKGAPPDAAENNVQRALDRLCEKADLPRFDGTAFRKWSVKLAA